ncbi:type III secretion protein [Brenneria izadpanahii]|uniref:Type III secretion protein n=1 Tax=Brenneria izadpanahii TaxID=2722756 RepID=A0ABX7UWY5_9GAMM|nr:type III secretion protein [Brenneria izadpanahii]QTF08193.1 type III secretion protein [Brenneria izadpanahii]
MNEEPAVFMTREAFLAAMSDVPTGCWRPQEGVSLLFRRRSREPELQLLLAFGRRYPGMLHQLLQRRFLEAETLADCSLSMNDQRDVALRCPLPETDEERRLALTKLWRLSGLPPL